MPFTGQDRAVVTHDRPRRRRHVRAVPALLRAASLHQGEGPSVRRCDRRAADRAADAGKGATHLGVATDHVIESFRKDLGPDYKTGEGIEPALFGQFHPLEKALAAMGVAVWPMVELEADDALASAARIAARDRRVQKVCIWSVDKDLAQCVRDDRVVQMDRRSSRRSVPMSSRSAPAWCSRSSMRGAFADVRPIEPY